MAVGRRVTRARKENRASRGGLAVSVAWYEARWDWWKRRRR